MTTQVSDIDFPRTDMHGGRRAIGRRLLYWVLIPLGASPSPRARGQHWLRSVPIQSKST
jgi:hypothetical protein